MHEIVEKYNERLTPLLEQDLKRARDDLKQLEEDITDIKV
jgi:hypothetical protein